MIFHHKYFRYAIVVIILALLTNLYSQNSWNKHPTPILSPGNAGTWDDSKSVANTILFQQNLYKMWYEGDDGFGYATSLNGTEWAKDTLSNPILEPGLPNSWDETEINNASIIFKDNMYHMWYSGVDFFDDNRIGHATSPDGLFWTKDSANPVLDHGTPGSWDDEEVIHPFVLVENDTFKMWYNGHDGVTQRILYAQSLDGRVWQRFTAHPILEPGPPGTWDQNELGPLCVLILGGEYHMWYTGWNNSDEFGIGHATSIDGLFWTKDSANPVLEPGDPGTWDNMAVALPFVIFENDSLKMYYGGFDGYKFQTGYATKPFIPSGINEGTKSFGKIPLKFELRQNYPNPFNPTTTIEFSTPPADFVTLKIYNILGEEVERLVSQKLMAGEYEYNWNAGDLASGVYLYQLKAGLFVDTKKMLLLK